jgi:hypothetical protein
VGSQFGKKIPVWGLKNGKSEMGRVENRYSSLGLSGKLDNEEKGNGMRMK